MKHASTIVLASVGALAVALATAAHADTRNSDKGRTTMEQKASPSNPVKQDEERTEAHSQPDVPNAGGTTPRNTKKAAPKKSSDAKKDKDKSKDKSSSSGGSSAPSPAMDAVAEKRFKALDIDGDGAISKAEAAGNADIVKDFDHADRDGDGKLSRAEYGAVGKPRPAKKQASR
jgi:hypothetical protein